MKRIMLFMFAAVLCCGIQSLSAVDSAKKVVGQSDAVSGNVLTQEHVQNFVNQVAAGVEKSLTEKGTLGDCSATDVASTVGASAAKCLAYKIPLLSKFGFGSASDCAAIVQGFTEKCCEDADEKMSTCTNDFSMVLVDMPNAVDAAAKNATSILPSVVQTMAVSAIDNATSKLTGTIESYGCGPAACGTWPVPRLCSYFSTSADEISTCWDSGSANVTPQALAFLKEQGAALAGKAPGTTSTDDGSRVAILRGVYWPTDGTKADCWTEDNCSKNPNACNADYAAKCRGDSVSAVRK